MADDTLSEFTRLGRVAKRTLFGGPRDIHLPLEGAALKRKEEQDANQKLGMQRLGELMRGKALTSLMKDK